MPNKNIVILTVKIDSPTIWMASILVSMSVLFTRASKKCQKWAKKIVLARVKVS